MVIYLHLVTDPQVHSRVASRLVIYGSRFATFARVRAGEARSTVALRVLSVLQQLGPTRIGDLAHRERLTQPAISATVNKLEADGLVTREPDPTDARASLVRITPAGDTEIEGFRERAAAAVVPALEQLSPEEWDTLSRATDILERITTGDSPLSA